MSSMTCTNTRDLFFVGLMAMVEEYCNKHRHGTATSGFELLELFEGYQCQVTANTFFFTTVALAIIHRIQNRDSPLHDCLIAIGIPNSKLYNIIIQQCHSFLVQLLFWDTIPIIILNFFCDLYTVVQV